MTTGEKVGFAAGVLVAGYGAFRLGQWASTKALELRDTRIDVARLVAEEKAAAEAKAAPVVASSVQGG